MTSSHTQNLPSTTVLQNYQLFILEIGRSHKTRLSTLLIWPNEGKHLREKAIKILIEKFLINLVRNNRHWNKADISRNPMAQIIKVKHLDTWEPIDWADVLLNIIEDRTF